jgi:hypothetical protein
MGKPPPEIIDKDEADFVPIITSGGFHVISGTEQVE